MAEQEKDEPTHREMALALARHATSGGDIQTFRPSHFQAMLEALGCQKLKSDEPATFAKFAITPSPAVKAYYVHPWFIQEGKKRSNIAVAEIPAGNAFGKNPRDDKSVRSIMVLLQSMRVNGLLEDKPVAGAVPDAEKPQKKQGGGRGRVSDDLEMDAVLREVMAKIERGDF